MYNDQEKFYSLVLDEMNRRSGEPNILVLFSYKNDLIEKLITASKAKLTIVATDFSALQNDRIDKWAEDPFKFIELVQETKTKFDMVLLLNPEEYFGEGEVSFEELHKELIRDLQRTLLNESGLIILLTHKDGFKLDDYVKPGADKLTKKVLNEEERVDSKLQAYAFYK